MRACSTVYEWATRDRRQAHVRAPTPPTQAKETAAASSTLVAMLGYAACSATLLVCNKVAVSVVPAPSFILLCQFCSSTFTCCVLSAAGLAEVEPLRLEKVRLFFGVAVLFCLCVFTNVRALAYTNVETVIVCRSVTPIVVALADWRFLGQVSVGRVCAGVVRAVAGWRGGGARQGMATP